MKRNWLILAVGALLLAGVQSAFALLVEVSATWDSSTHGNVQNGSIVQVVVYNHNTPGVNAPDPDHGSANFTQYGTTGSSSDPVYLPDTTPDGHQIVSTGHVTQEGNLYKFQTYVDLPNASAYDRIYIRVFETATFPDNGTPVQSWWGISDVEGINAGPGTIGVVWFDDVQLSNQDWFEVIPEPGTVGLLWSGVFGTGVAGLWRRGRRKGKARAGETGVVEP